MGTFAEQETNSIYWHNKASALRAAAAAIHHAMISGETFPKDAYGFSAGFRMEVACPLVYRMLWGMALEALIKAVIVERGIKIRTSHNLDQLARDAGISFTNEQQKILQILSESVIWDGRYPVPKYERYWDDLRALKMETLFDRKPIADGSSLNILSPNEAMSWESLVDVWNQPMSELCRIASWLQS